MQPNFLRHGPNSVIPSLPPPVKKPLNQVRVSSVAAHQNIVSLNSLSQQTQQTSTASVDESPPQDGGRAQAKFQELISRSRHLESMEILHDIKNRLTNLETLVTNNHSAVKEAICNLEKKIEIDAEGAICSTTQVHQYQNILIMDVMKKLEQCCDKIETVETTLTHINHARGNCSPDSDDGMSVGYYLKSKRTSSRIPQENNTRTHEEDIDLMNDNYYEYLRSPDQDDDESSSMHSHMTEPIKYRKSH